MWIKVLQDMNTQTEWFIIAILLFTAYFHFKFTPNNMLKAPAFLTTLGILGTFTGIAFGLLDFNPKDVQKSVPMLIDGIKTAVWASACGIFCALTIKLRDMAEGKKITTKGASGASINDLAVLLKNIEQGIAPLPQELRQLHADSNSRLDHLNNSLDGFYKNMAESNARALVEALNTVMRDFNTKLNEQFGENFKRLNDACEKMLQWQQTYAQQMGLVIDQQGMATRNMEVASQRYQSMIEQANVFNTTAASLSSLLNGLESQRIHLEGSMRELANLINTASGGLPQIEQKIIAMVNQLNGGLQTTNNEFNKSVKELIERTKEQVVVLDKALSEELTKALESFGQQLGALSEKFSEDYTPITERLKAVLDIGR